ncbi:hypothetical protein ACTFIZ_001040 [Dictyostelium cf. discoideum]
MKLYLEKAVEMGDLLITESQITLATHDKTYPGWTGGRVILAEAYFLEFNEFLRISGDPKSFPVFINQDANGFCGSLITVGGLGDSYYEYLLKMWIYTNGEDEVYRRLFIESADSIIEHMYKVSPKGDGYLSTLDHGSLTNTQEHLTCFAGGMFALAAAANITHNHEKSAKYMEVGEMLVYLRPETVESLFILYRLTGDTKYQEWSWKIFEAIEDVCKQENGYAVISLYKYIFNTKAHPILIPNK